MHDLQLTAFGDLAIYKHDVLSTDSIVQKVLIRLRWFLGEWVYNEDYGLPWFEKILIKKPNTTLIKSLIEQEILSVDGVEDVQELTLTVNQTTRVATIGFHLYTEQGAEDALYTSDLDNDYYIKATVSGTTLILEGPISLMRMSGEDLGFGEDANVTVSDSTLIVEEVEE